MQGLALSFTFSSNRGGVCGFKSLGFVSSVEFEISRTINSPLAQREHGSYVESSELVYVSDFYYPLIAVLV